MPSFYEGVPIINDSTPEEEYMSATFGRGLDLSLRTAEGYAGVASPFPPALLIPRHEWQARIEERKAKKATMRDMAKLYNIACKDQKSISYCWVFAPTHCMELIRAKQGQKNILLSPASAGAQIKNFRNVGGWGREALAFIANYGVCPQEFWPECAIERRYLTEENKAKMLDHRATEWVEAVPRNVDQFISLLFHNIPVAGGYNWWGHEITNYDPEWIDNDIAALIRNQWGMGWGDEGFSILQGNRMIPDDIVAPYVAVAS